MQGAPAAFGSLATLWLQCATGTSTTTDLHHFIEGAGAGKSASLACMSLSLELGTDPLYCYQ